MNDKENSEIKRHTKLGKSNITAIYGCYVNSQKTVLSKFRLSTGMMTEPEAEKYFAILKKSLSGTLGKNLIDIAFSTQQVLEGPEHKLLMDLRESRLEDEERLSELYDKIIQSVTLEENFLILVACDAYDVPFKNKNDDADSDRMEETYRYLLCGVCPVKETKPSLVYDVHEKVFHEGGVSQIIGAPAVGFLFPTFDDRTTNIYHAQFYTKDTGDNHPDLVEALFNTTPVMSAKSQKVAFEALLTNSLDEECSMDVVQAVHTELANMILMHKEAKVADPLLIGKEQVTAVLASSGVDEDKIAKFGIDYDDTFGFEAEIHPRNVIDQKHFEVKTPDVVIHVSPDSSHLVQTRIIDGVKYILVTADENVEVNGVSINIQDEKVPVLS